MAHALAALETSIGRILKSAGSWIPTGLAHYLNARKVLRGSISKQSRRAKPIRIDVLLTFLPEIMALVVAAVAVVVVAAAV